MDSFVPSKKKTFPRKDMASKICIKNDQNLFFIETNESSSEQLVYNN